MPLYYIADDGPESEPRSCDLFVRAIDRDEAMSMWRQYYDTDKNPFRIDEIPTKPEHGPIKWEDVPCVWQP